MDILELVFEATKETKSFANHPARKLDFEERLLYLNGLSLVMNVDAEIDDDEKEYLRILLKSFEMAESLLEEFVRFSKEPDKDTIQAFFKTFKRKEIARLFLFDALMLTRRDGKINERETALIDKMVEELEIAKGVYAEIYDLFCHIKNKDWEETRSFFNFSHNNVEYFRHVLDYYEVSLEDVLERKAEAFHKRLGFEWMEAKYFGEEDEQQVKKARSDVFGHLSQIALSTKLAVSMIENVRDESQQLRIGTFITSNPVTHFQFVEFLQFAMDSKEIVVRNGKVFDRTDFLLMDLTIAKINYDPEDKFFSCSDELLKTSITGFTPIGARAFARSVKCMIGYGPDYGYRDSVLFPLQEENEPLKNEIVYGCNGKYYCNRDGKVLISNKSYQVANEELSENGVFRVMKVPSGFDQQAVKSDDEAGVGMKSPSNSSFLSKFLPAVSE